MFSKNLLATKTVLILLAAFGLFLGNLKYQQLKQQKAIEKEKQGLLLQQRQLTESNDQLSDSLSYLTSDDFKERAARQQLNMKKEGETVYNFSQNPDSSSTESNNENNNSSNAQKWWKYFFQNK